MSGRRLRVSLSSLLALVLAVGCSSSQRGSVEIELAPESACGQPSEPLEATWDCLRLQVCPVAETSTTDAGPRDAGGGSTDAGTSDGCVLISAPGGDHATATSELIVQRVTLTSFDAQVDPTRRYDVVVTAYDDTGAPIATGTAHAVSPLGSTVRVRLHRYGISSCGPLLDSNARPAHRAMGAGVLLPSGNVLFFGGITGLSLRGTGLNADARFQPTIEAFELASNRFHPVTVQNEDDPGAGPGFARVLFEARLLGTASDGRARIRVFGGFTSTDTDGPALRFDAALSGNAYAMPYLPSVDTSAGAVVDILYDEAARVATIVPATMTAVAGSGGASVSELVDGRVVSIGGIKTHGGMAAARDLHPDVEGDWFVWSADGVTRSDTMAALETSYARIGGTVTHLEGDDFLAWGGGLTVTPPMPYMMPFNQYLNFAGLVLTAPATAAGTVTPVVSMPPTQPSPVAFHTATRVAPNTVLVTGGFAIISAYVPDFSGSFVAPMSHSLTPAGEPPGFSILARDFTGAFHAATVSGDPRAATILHQVTTLTEAGGVPTALLVTGGALTQGAPELSLHGSDEIGVLRGAGEAWTYDALPLGLRLRRWGHTTTALPNGTVLVAGGYDGAVVSGAGLTLTQVDDAEVLVTADLLGLPRPAPVNCDDAGMTGPADAGRDAPATDAPVETDVPDAPVDLDAPPDDAPL